MKVQGPFKTIEYDEKYALQTVQMWRASMEKALGIKDHHSWEEQLNYLEKIAKESCLSGAGGNR